MDENAQVVRQEHKETEERSGLTVALLPACESARERVRTSSLLLVYPGSRKRARGLGQPYPPEMAGGVFKGVHHERRIDDSE